MRRQLASLVVALTLAAPLSAQVIDTRRPVGDPLGMSGFRLGTGWGLFGDSWNLIGQTWVAPAALPGNDLRLESFRFWLYGEPLDPARPAVAATFVGRLQEWSGTAPVGPVLYESALQTGPAAGATRVAYDFSSAMVLTPGARYITYLYAGAPEQSALQTHTRVYTEGGMRLADGGQYIVNARFGVESTGAGDMPDVPMIIAFSGGATSTVPEPSTWALLGTVLLVLGAVTRRRGRPA